MDDEDVNKETNENQESELETIKEKFPDVTELENENLHSTDLVDPVVDTAENIVVENDGSLAIPSDSMNEVEIVQSSSINQDSMIVQDVVTVQESSNNVFEKNTNESNQKKTPSNPPSRPASKSPSKAPSAVGSKAPSRAGSKQGSPTRATSSKPGTANSKARSRSPAPSSGRQSGKKRRRKNDQPVVLPGEGLPDGCTSIFLSGPTQEIFKLKADDDVTAQNPYKFVPKEDIIKDLFKRAAVSDFSVMKDVINNYPGTDIMIVYDADFKYGQNFYIAKTEEAKATLLAIFNKESEAQSDGEGLEEEEDYSNYVYVPPESKPWISYGSELEIYENTIKLSRPLIKTIFDRERREFGAPCNFSDRNVADATDGYVAVQSVEDKSLDVSVMEFDREVQVVPEICTLGIQTDWKYPKNAHTQYSAREFTEEERVKQLESDELKFVINSNLPKFAQALQHNEILDYYHNHYDSLSQGEAFDTRSDTLLKEYQSFTDLKFSKDKAITCIDWHPTIKGLVAMSVAEKMTFDQRIDNGPKIVLSQALIIIWSIADPIQPQLLLEAPDDIFCFQFCPSDPHIVAGGCINGQVVIWDIEKHIQDLQNVRNKMKTRRSGANLLATFDDDTVGKIPCMRYCAVSSIEHSHIAPITDLIWVPDHFEITRMGYPIENKNLKNFQLMTCSMDHTVNFWDIRPVKGGTQDKSKAYNTAAPAGVPQTFTYLDLKWKPLLKVHVFGSEQTGDYAPTKFCIQEVQGDRRVLDAPDDSTTQDFSSTAQGNFSFGTAGKPASAGGKQRNLQNVQTHFYIGSEVGELIYVDWMPQKDQDSGKIQTAKPAYVVAFHDGPINAIARAPFNRQFLLVVGGWFWSLWKEGVTSGPIINSRAGSKPLTGGIWSPTRPAVFFITRADGFIEVWDLLDKTHEPILQQNLSAVSLTSIKAYHVNSKQQFVAVGDTNGTLHVYQVPWRLRSKLPEEKNLTSAAFDREVNRRLYVIERWNFREQERMEKEREAKQRAGIAPQVNVTEEELYQKMKIEYGQYLEMEQAFLRDLGLKDDDDLKPATQIGEEITVA